MQLMWLMWLPTLLKHYWNTLMLQHAGTALSQHASRAMVRFSEHCELCAGCPSLNHSTVHRNRSSRHHSRSSREVRETHLSWCGGPSIILGNNELGLFRIWLKNYKIITSDKDLHNLRLFGRAPESSTSHRTIYYFKICNLHKLFEKPTQLQIHIKIRIISAS